MAKVPVPFGNIESWTPGIDPRQTPGKVYVLQGRNFYFDSKGPRSGFGTRLLARGQIIGSVLGIAQSVTISNRTFLCVPSGIFELERDGSDWIERLDLSDFTLVPFLPEKKWTTATLAKGSFLCHVNYGIQKLTFNGFSAITQDNTPGLVYGPIAIAETNGRLIILGRKYVEWSNANDPENFVPELGGAGSQLLSDIVPGEPITVAGFQNGFLVWTTEACMLAEFIGGDNVFRFVRQTTKLLPLDANCVEDIPDGSQLILTKQGIHRIVNGSEPERLVPLFNEFLRQELEHEAKLQFRLNYDMENDRLWVQIRDWTNHYVRTYVLSVSIDKWGEFNQRHLGVIQWSPKRGSNGYVDDNGVAHKFVDNAHNRETSLHQFQGLDSEITLGYVRPKELWPEIDALLEMQEINIGSHSARPSYEVPIYIDLGEVEGTPSPEFVIDFVDLFYSIRGVERSLEDLLDIAQIDQDDIIAGVGMDASNNSNSVLEATPELLQVIKDMMENALGFSISFEMAYSTGRADDFRAGGYLLRFTNEDPENTDQPLSAWDSEAYVQTDLPNTDSWWYNLTEDTGVGYGDTEWRPMGYNKMVLSMKPAPAQVDGDRVIGLNINGAPGFSDTSTYDTDFLASVKEATKAEFVLFDLFGEITKRPFSGLGAEHGASGFIRRIIGYADGDEAKNIERSALVYPKVTEVGNATSAWSHSTTTCTVNIPNETLSGHLGLLWVHHRQALSPVDGWELVHTLDYKANGYTAGTVDPNRNTPQKISLYKRVMLAGDAGDPVILTQASAAPMGATIGIFTKPSGTPEIVWSITKADEKDPDTIPHMSLYVDESYTGRNWERLALLAYGWNAVNLEEPLGTKEDECPADFPGADNAEARDHDGWESMGENGPLNFFRLAVKKKQFGGNKNFTFNPGVAPNFNNTNIFAGRDYGGVTGYASTAYSYGVIQVVLG